MNYRAIIKTSQLKDYNAYAPIAAGDYAVVVNSPESGFRLDDVVKIDRITDRFAFVKKFQRSKSGWVSIDNLEKIKMVRTDEARGEAAMIPMVIESVTTLKDSYPDLWRYFGQRIKRIFGDEMTTVEANEVIPTINPKVVIGRFLGSAMGGAVQGFVSPEGPDKGIIFINFDARTETDEIIAHEFSHLLSFYSHDLAEKLNNPSLQLGVSDEEVGIEQRQKKLDEDMEEWKKLNLTPDEIQKITQNNYFLQPAEIFAHIEQMVYIVNKLKRIEKNHVAMDESMTPDQKKQAAAVIESRPMSYYKNKVMNKLVPYMAEKYKIRDYTSRKIYESLFNNAENYAPSAVGLKK